MRSAASMYATKWRRPSINRSSFRPVGMRTSFFQRPYISFHPIDSNEFVNSSCSRPIIISIHGNSKLNNSRPFYAFPFPHKVCNRKLERFSYLSSTSFSGTPHSSLPGEPNPHPPPSDDSSVCKVDGNRDDCYDKSNSGFSSQDCAQSPSSRKIITLPTVLTMGRVVAVPLLVATFYIDNWWGRTATASIFVAAAVTDWLDGYLARKMKLGTEFGAFLDPVADKLMVATALVLLCTRRFENTPWLLTIPSIAIIGREITMSAVREWAASRDPKLLQAVAVNNLGKWKAATQMVALVILLGSRESSFGWPGGVVTMGLALLYVSAGLSLWSLGVYMSKIWRVLIR